MDIKDKVVVITGSSRGLGKGLAEAFAKRNARVVMSSRNKSELDLIATKLGALAIAADVRKEEEMLALAREVIQRYGQIDIWINNAGIWIPHASIEETNWTRVHEIMEVNLFGLIYGTKAALLQMRKQKSGMIINVLSTAALDGRAGSSGYGATKYAAVGFTKSLRKEVEGSGINVLAVYPGGMQTNFFDEKKPADIDKYMLVDHVAEKIIQHIIHENPDEDLIIKRPAS